MKNQDKQPSQTARRIAIVGLNAEHQADAQELEMFTIYDHPADYPNHFAVKRWTIAEGTPRPDDSITLTATLEEARATIKPGLYCIHRELLDDPKIVETWI
jgi:hypothetical protein